MAQCYQLQKINVTWCTLGDKKEPPPPGAKFNFKLVVCGSRSTLFGLLTVSWSEIDTRSLVVGVTCG